MNNSMSWFAALSALFLLLLVGGGAFSGFQSWVQVRATAQAPTEVMREVFPALRSVVSSQVVIKAPESEKLSEAVKSLSYRQPRVETAEPTPEPQQQKGEVDFVEPSRGPVSEKPAVSQPVISEHEPVVVVYENELVLEFPFHAASEKNVKRAIARLLLSEQPFSEALMSNEPIQFRKKPYFFKQVLDEKQRPIRYPADAFEYVDYLLNSEFSETLQDEEGKFLAVHVPLKKVNYPKPVQQYKSWVDQYSEQFSVSPELVFAIMETESAFRPDAVSRSNALGLMQLKPHAAGRDVYQYIDAKPGIPSKRELFDEENNIRMGTAYLGLLKHDYLAQVRNDRNRELLAISAYNGGLSTVTRLFGKTPQEALARINQLHPRQVYRKLRYEHQSDETRQYLEKVLKAKKRYQEILGYV